MSPMLSDVQSTVIDGNLLQSKGRVVGSIYMPLKLRWLYNSDTLSVRSIFLQSG